jgi:hypothetical protein
LAGFEVTPEGLVLNRQTGYFPGYGHSTYIGYEFGDAPSVSGARPIRKGNHLDRVLAVTATGRRRAYAFDFLRRMGVVEDRLGDTRYVIFFDPEMLSPLDAPRIIDSRSPGSAAVYLAELAGRRLRFRRRDARIVDRETGSTWDILGLATDGPLKGTRLTPAQQMIYFEFAHRNFFPRSQVVGGSRFGSQP